jgi:hypothetical protein
MEKEKLKELLDQVDYRDTPREVLKNRKREEVWFQLFNFYNSQAKHGVSMKSVWSYAKVYAKVLNYIHEEN